MLPDEELLAVTGGTGWDVIKKDELLPLKEESAGNYQINVIVQDIHG